MYIADTPERNKLLLFLDGGLYGLRSLHAGRINTKLLLPCEKCFVAMLELYHGEINDSTDVSCPQGHQCNACCCGCYYSKSTALTRDYNNDLKHYSKTCAPDSPECPKFRSVHETNLRPLELTFEEMCKAIRFAAHNRSRWNWTKQEVRKFLQTMSVSTYVQEAVADITPGEEFNEEIIPYLWRSLFMNVKKMIETPMHELDHGGVGTIITDSIQPVITQQSN